LFFCTIFVHVFIDGVKAQRSKFASLPAGDKGGKSRTTFISHQVAQGEGSERKSPELWQLIIQHFS